MGSIPTRYIVFDTETREHVISREPREVSLKFRLGVAKLVHRHKDGSTDCEYRDLHSPEDLFAWIDSLPVTKEKIHIFAHNLGFDLRIVGLFDHVASKRYTLLNPFPSYRSLSDESPFLVLDDPPTIIRLYRPDGQECLWLDSWQWLSSSLKKIGEILGNAKGVMPSLDASNEEWFPYCRQDVDVLDDAMSRIFAFLDSIRCQSFHPTRAGQARLIYTQKYEKKRIVYHENPGIQSIERPSYYGGFTECFRVGPIETHVHQLDITVYTLM